MLMGRILPKSRFNGLPSSEDAIILCLFVLTQYRRDLSITSIQGIHRHETAPRYRNAAAGGLSHGHRGSAPRISWRSVQRFQRYARRQTDRRTGRHTHRQADRNTPLPYRGGVISSYQLTYLLTYLFTSCVCVSRHTR